MFGLCIDLGIGCAGLGFNVIAKCCLMLGERYFACGVYCGDLVLFGVMSLVFVTALLLLGWLLFSCYVGAVVVCLFRFVCSCWFCRFVL